MMSRKAALFGDYDILKQILNTDDPAVCKKLGRQVRHFDADKWTDCREEVVYRANLEKFRQNSDLWGVLMGTGKATLAEASPTDRIWGIGMSALDPKAKFTRCWNGQNLLGKTLMRVRAALR